MQSVKRSFLYLLFFAIVLNHSFVLQSMELQVQEIEINWSYKKRDYMSLGCFRDTNETKYPYFLESDEPREKISEEAFIKRYRETFNQDSYQDTFQYKPCHISSLGYQEKQTVWYVLEMIEMQKLAKDQSLKIEGRDKDFAKEMSKRILSLPQGIRKQIAEKTNNRIISNIDYGPSYFNTILDDEDYRERCSYIGACCGIYSGFCLSEYCFLKYMGQTNYPSLYCTFSGLLSSALGYYFFEKMKNHLCKLTQDKERRYGFETKALLTEMECSIVKYKDKKD